MSKHLIAPHLTFVVAVMCVFSGPGNADQDDLSGGVFIMHSPPDVLYTTQSAAELCDSYWSDYAIDNCAEQNPHIDTTEPTLWYILSAWSEDKLWCGTEFGFGDYDPGLFVFTDWSPCGFGFLLEITTGAWPGPNSGTAFAVAETGAEWTGNFVPVYCFTGYAYAAGLLPLVPDPHYPPLAGWGNCQVPALIFDAACLPSLGVLTDGIPCCPDEPTPAEPGTWGRIKAAYR